MSKNTILRSQEMLVQMFFICLISFFAYRGLLSSPNHIIALRQILLTHYIPPLKIHEFFMTDIDREVEKFMAYKGGCFIL